MQVEVTGKSGDGGIDGRGIAKINGILSFHIVFQCKRYKGKVSSKEIRDFRGAMVGRTDKGLFITTGSFTRNAIDEATRDGAPTIDLIDGDKLAETLKELGLGVKVKIKEEISIDEEWFKNID
ncbi:MAG: restriction endonuclease [Prolixibacteraceae bacterium]|nr:restriction endonuclease [Prolixibacteraceae bacterium]